MTRQPEPKTRLKPKNIEDLVRHFILDHSEELFIDQGYQKTSMDMIARACGMSKPTLYNYFHGKHEIFTRLYQRLFKSLNDGIKARIAQGGEGRRVFLDIIDQYFSWLFTKRGFLQMYFREQHLVIHEDIDEHMAWHIRSKKDMTVLLSKALAGIVRPDVKKGFNVDIAASTLFNVFEGLISSPALKSEGGYDEQKRFLLELFQRGILSEKR